MNTPPQPSIAAALGFVAPPVGMLYASGIRAALLCLAASLALALLAMTWLHHLAPALGVAFALTVSVLAARAAKHAHPAPSRPRIQRWYGLLGFALIIGLTLVVLRAFFFEPFQFPGQSMLPGLRPQARAVVWKWGFGRYEAYGFTIARRPVSANLARGDMVVFRVPAIENRTYLSRVVGLAGDRIDYIDKRLAVNGTAVPLRQIENLFVGGITAGDRLRFVETLDASTYEILNDPRVPAELKQHALPVPPEHAAACQQEIRGFRCQVPAGHYFMLSDNRDAAVDSRVYGFVADAQLIGKVCGVFR